MLTIAKLAKGSEGYYLETVARGAEDYYVGRGEAPGYWTGHGAELLGLDGEVTAPDLRAILEGRAPDGSVLGAANRTVPGFDFTFSVPKSVSVLAALCPDLSEGIVDACEIAVASTLGWLEAHACVSRRGRNGIEHVDGDGFVAAAFRHRTSRAGDPQLHWHVLVANTTRGPDGTWRTLDGTRIYPALRTAGFLFEAELRHHLSERFGVRWGPVRNGIAEIDGIPPGLLRTFSKRRSQIEDRLTITGHSTGRAAQVAAYATRSRKPVAEPYVDLRQRWTSEAIDAGFNPRQLRDTLDRPIQPVELSTVVPRLLGPTGLTFQQSTFTRFDALRALASEARHGAGIAEIDAAGSELLVHPDAVDLGQAWSAGVRLSNGATLDAGTRGYSTTELMAIERRLIRQSRTDTHRRPVVGRAVAHGLLARDRMASDEQRRAVLQLTTEPRLVATLVAAAGSGKTFSLNLARQLFEYEGHRVIGAALAARAAKELGDQAHIPARTITQLEIDLDRGDEILDARTVLVIDEAAMVGTRALARLIDRAEPAGARVILVGDPKQLQAIEAGGLLRALTPGGATLTENRRQQQPWERQALASLRAGEIGPFLTAYQRHGRVHVGDTADDAKRQLITRWAELVRVSPDVIILAIRRADVADLNRQARDRLLNRGLLGTEAIEAAGREFRVGDQIVCLRNRRALGLLNGSRGVVTSIDPDRRHLDAQLRDGTARRIPASYLDAGHLDHGYAMTIHKAQGATVDHALVLATDDLYQEATYTALSRARHGSHIYAAADNFTNDPTIDLSHAAQREARYSAAAILDRAMNSSRQQTLAIELAQRGSAEHEHLARP